jgi:hypothetical protein
MWRQSWRIGDCHCDLVIMQVLLALANETTQPTWLCDVCPKNVSLLELFETTRSQNGEIERISNFTLHTDVDMHG